MFRRVLYLVALAGLTTLALSATTQPLAAQDCAECLSKTSCGPAESGGAWCSFLGGDCHEKDECGGKTEPHSARRYGRFRAVLANPR